MFPYDVWLPFEPTFQVFLLFNVPYHKEQARRGQEIDHYLYHEGKSDAISQIRLSFR
jgi:hypothetical protein